MSREAPLAMDPEAFREAGHELVDRLANFLEELPTRKVAPGLSPMEVRERLGASRPLPDSGAEPAGLLREAAELVIENSLYNGHPRFLGYITASPAPIGALADLLAATVNPNVGAWVLSPMATEIEAQTVRWIAELIGYPTDCGGLLVSGGNMANLVGFLAARAAVGGEWGIRERGLTADDAALLRVYVSAETHTWVQKAADLFGLGTDAIRWIETDERLRMDVGALRKTIEKDRREGHRPLMVVGTAGSVSTGAIDPLPEIARLCREERIWFHVDGAYGGFAAALPDAPAELRGLSEADSVAVDPHKWLYSPLEAGSILVRDGERLPEAFAYRPPYYYFDVEATSYVDVGPQNSRGFRALKVWLGLRHAGREGYVQMISRDIELGERLYQRASEHPELEAIIQGLSVAVFRYVPPELREGVGEASVEGYLNELNEEIQARLEAGGEIFLSNAVVRDRYALRGCVVNFNTTEADIDAISEIVVHVGREVHRTLAESAPSAS